MDPQHEVPLAKSADDQTPDSRPGQWNQVRLTRADDEIELAVNERVVGRFQFGIDQRFGFYCEPGRSERIRSAVRTGDWPEEVPDGLFAR